MRELTQVCKAVVEALKSAGVTALEAFPDSAKRYEGAVAHGLNQIYLTVHMTV